MNLHCELFLGKNTKKQKSEFQYTALTGITDHS